MKDKRLIAHPLAFTILMVVLFAFLAFDTSAAEPTKAQSRIDQIKATGKLIVGTSADYPPYEFYLQADRQGELAGIDVDIAKSIAQKIGVKLEIRDMVFSNIFEELGAGKIDLAIAGLSPTEKRREVADFSDFYYQAIQKMLIRFEDLAHIKSLEDLRGKMVGVQKSSIQEDFARAQILGAGFIAQESIPVLIDDLKKGVTAAVILEKPVAEAYVDRNIGLISIECSSDRVPLGSAVAVRKGDTDLLRVVNETIDMLIKSNKITEFIEDAKFLSNKR